MKIRVWGARGSLSAPGPATVGYGGNTSCVEVELADGTSLILDAGSGIRELGQRLLGREQGELHICLTHLHVDHVEGLGFFGPLWRAGWKLRFWGPPSTTATLRERVSRYLSPPLFPIGLSEAPAEAVFEDAPREPWRIGSAVIEAQMVEHRGPTLGYRIEDEGRVLAYVPDHEPYLTAALGDEPKWISGWALAAGADLLLHDSQYTDEEYPSHLGWGHPPLTDALEFARRAHAGRLLLFHHDPLHSDDFLDAVAVTAAERWAAMGGAPGAVALAAEGATASLPSAA